MRVTQFGRRGGRQRCAAAALARAALDLGLLAVTLVGASCGASIETAVRGDGGAQLRVAAEIPAPLAAKLRKLAQANAQTPLFDAAAIRKALAERPGLSAQVLVTPTPDSIRAEITARSLETLAAEPDLAESGVLAFSRGAGWAELRIRLVRGKAASFAALFPGLDPYIIDALSPPALEEEPVTAAEYRRMLASLLGERAMPAMESASLHIALTAPGLVIGSGGGELSGSRLSLSVPIIDALVLEKPIEFWLRWKN